MPPSLTTRPSNPSRAAKLREERVAPPFAIKAMERAGDHAKNNGK